MEDFTGGIRFIGEVIIMQKKWFIGLLLLAVIILAAVGLDQRMIVRRYTIETDKLDTPVHLAVVTDYHGCDYGLHGNELIQEVTAATPDAIMLVGDMFSADGDPYDELVFFEKLADIADTYYVTGNHEYWEYDVPALLQLVDKAGVIVLDQRAAKLTAGGQTLNICGIPDPYAYVDTSVALEQACSNINLEEYTILLAHRPELIETYAATQSFDLVLSGHAHGGQVRIPFLVNGLCAPNQGWFPQYAGGRYEVEGTTMIVSRGLSTQRQMGVPRIFNRPELVLVTIE